MGEVVAFRPRPVIQEEDLIVPCAACGEDAWLFRADNQLECVACGTIIDNVRVVTLSEETA